jgi:hypothetical protein
MLMAAGQTLETGTWEETVPYVRRETLVLMGHEYWRHPRPLQLSPRPAARSKQATQVCPQVPGSSLEAASVPPDPPHPKVSCQCIGIAGVFRVVECVDRCLPMEAQRPVRVAP